MNPGSGPPINGLSFAPPRSFKRVCARATRRMLLGCTLLRCSLCRRLDVLVVVLIVNPFAVAADIDNSVRQPDSAVAFILYYFRLRKIAIVADHSRL